jgi:tRNA(adenine34) deaminase
MGSDSFFMNKALALAAESLESGEFPVGCVLVANEMVVAEGNRKKSAGEVVNEIDHAEMIALKSWASQGYPFRSSGVTAYTTLEPCMMCLGALILNGVKRIVYAFEDVMGGATGIDFTTPLSAVSVVSGPLSKWAGDHLYLSFGNNITGGVERKASLMLFKRFFLDESNSYWKESLLSRHILSQDI